MSANAALIFDFNAIRAERSRKTDSTPRVDLAEAMKNLMLTAQWLAGRGVLVLGFAASTLHAPVVIVAAQREVWALFAGKMTNPGHRMDGAFRYEVWESEDCVNRVTVRWQEVSACG